MRRRKKTGLLSQWRLHMIRLWLSAMSFELLILLQSNLVCWHKLDCLFKGQILLLCSRPGLQQRLKMSMTVHLNDIFSTAEPFVTKLGMAMQHHVMWKDWFDVFKVKVPVRANVMKYDCFYHIYWIADLLATHGASSLAGVSWVKTGLLCQSQSKGSKRYWIFVYNTLCTTDLLAINVAVFMYYYW